MEDNGLAKALGRIPSGIFIVTAKKGDVKSALLASWVQQASFEPPTVSVAVHKNRSIDSILSEHTKFVINILSKDDEELYKKYVRGVAPDTDPFQGVKCEEASDGTPILSDSLGALECRVRNRVDVGDHHLIVADILAGRLITEEEPRVHIRKNGLSY